ncbi:DUF2975 domain-containing protein [Listeria innocua]|uniref:DUF2975 domain-containing protein n=1 Tax=Listeria innocua TaxID=1642 RepID=UPI001623D2A7|nr:DUF2975 domain-containing protein [Listeria innocua]MBC2124027.1 DUF2975 domain-containing protein [Listeria innocua]MBC2129412.1 DUF2975 domain-containing protein [Listeria innocua]
MKLKRLQKMSYFLHITLKILSVGAILIAALAIVLKLFNRNNISINKMELNTILNFNTEYFVGNDISQYVQTEEWLTVGISVLYAILIAWMLWIASTIFKDLAAEFTPFNDVEIKRLHRIAQLMLVYALGPQILYSALHTILIPGYSIHLGLDMAFFFAIIFYCLTEIFRYGAALQKESDETL